MFCVPNSDPVLKLVLFWNGTLTRLPTGFCASLASSSAVISACAGRHSIASAATAPAARAAGLIRGFMGWTLCLG